MCRDAAMMRLPVQRGLRGLQASLMCLWCLVHQLLLLEQYENCCLQYAVIHCSSSLQQAMPPQAGGRWPPSLDMLLVVDVGAGRTGRGLD